MKDLLKQYADYDRWANVRFVERLQREPETILDQAVASSFPSLRATILHIRNAEHVWWCRLSGQAPLWPASSDPSIATLIPQSDALRQLVHELDPAAFNEVHSYTDMRGLQHRQPAWMMILHCFNHSTQHRGQLITMMRALGLQEIPANDLVVYQRSLIAPDH